MNLKQIVNSVFDLSEKELVELNREVVRQIKSRRNIDARLKRTLFSAGDKVKWDGRQGPGEGKIIKVNRKKAIVEVDGFQRWNIPLNMLSNV